MIRVGFVVFPVEGTGLATALGRAVGASVTRGLDLAAAATCAADRVNVLGIATTEAPSKAGKSAATGATCFTTGSLCFFLRLLLFFRPFL